MSMRALHCILLAGAIHCAAAQQNAPEVDAILAAYTPEAKASAYRKLFENVGRKKLVTFKKHPDTSLALQAAWELARKPMPRRPKMSGRVDWIYDPVPLREFAQFVQERTGVPVPAWWRKAITDVDLFPREHHAFIGAGGGPVYKGPMGSPLTP